MKLKNNKIEKKKKRKKFSDHVIFAMNNMIPFLICGGIILSLSKILPYIFLNIDPSVDITQVINLKEGESISGILELSYLLFDVGSRLFEFAIPIFAGFIAVSIGGKYAFTGAFLGGLLSVNPTPYITSEGMVLPSASSFWGAIIIGIFVGYLVKFFKKKIKVSDQMKGFKNLFLLPLISVIFVIIAMQFFVTPLLGEVNVIIKKLLELAGKTGEYTYSIILSLATAIDLGGPINKGAGFVALGFSTDKVLPLTARAISISIPPIGLGLATILDKYIVGKRVFDKELYLQGKTAIFLGFMGISEGAIPFALKNPIVMIPAYLIGSVVGSLLAIYLGAVQWIPVGAIWGWPLAKNVWAYIIGIAVGALVTAFLAIILKNMQLKKLEKQKLKETL